MNTLRVSFEELRNKLQDIHLSFGFDKEKAHLSASLFAKASLDGVASHGLNRFPDFIRMISEGYIKPNAHPALVSSYGPFERWDGNLGPGNLNAHFSMERAIRLAQKNGLGCVALRNTNHWMRGGNYGWQAVDEDCIGICFTNTKPNLPAWGGSEVKLGNNPVVFAIPNGESPVVLDMALSQYAYGKIATYLKEGNLLPYAGGFGQNGELTKDPGTILEKEMGLPVGLWKGAGLSLVVDLICSVLANGDTTHDIGEKDEEFGLSQFFLCFDPIILGLASDYQKKIKVTLTDLKSSEVFEGQQVRYPGENTLKIRKQNMENGIPVDPQIWQEVLQLDS